MRRAGLLLLAGALACGGGAAPPPTESLALPSDTLEAPWSDPPVAAWLGDTRWALVAGDWDAATIADFSGRTLAPIGGSKQKAYVHPFSVFSVGDTVFLGDWGLRRVTVWTPDGKLLDSIPGPDALRGTLPRARDGARQLYFEVRPLAGRDGSGNRDSAAIVRAPRSFARFDSVARLAPLDLAQMRRENTTRYEPRIFAGGDLWGVWPDGTVWIMRIFHNRLVSVDRAGKVTTGPGLPDPVWEVTQADRDRYLQHFPVDVRPKETDLPWALIFPPFTAAYAAPDGRIWLEKSKPALDTLRRIQVLDRGGHLERVLELHGPGRLLGVGADMILIAEQFEKGVRLMRVRIPAGRRP